MLTNGKTPVSKSAAQQRYAERKAQPAQQGYNAVMTQQDEQSSTIVFEDGKHLLRFQFEDVLRGCDPAWAGDAQEILRRPGVHVDESFIRLDSTCKCVAKLAANVSTLGGKEIRIALDSYDAYVRAPLFAVILRRPLDHIKPEVSYDQDGFTVFRYKDELKLETCKVYTTIRHLGEVIKENGGSPVLTIKPGASVEEATGFNMDPAGYRPTTEVVNDNLGINWAQQHRGGACASMIKGQQETVMAETTQEEACEIRYNAIKYPLMSILRGLYMIKEYGYLELLNWHVPYITQPFPMGDFKSIAKFDVMMQEYSEDFYANYLGKDGVSEKFLKEYGDTPVQVYCIRRARSTAGANTALSMFRTLSSRDKLRIKDAKTEPVEVKTEVKTEPVEVKTEPEAKPAAKKPAARKATKKTTSSKAKAKAKAETKAAEEATSQAEAKAEDENQNVPF